MEGRSGPRVSRLCALAALGLVAALATAPMGENDLFFHLALGQRILATGAIPFRNLYSFTWPGYPDPDLAWGFQVLVAWLHAHAGFAAIVLLKVALVSAAAALAYLVARRRGAGVVEAAIAIVLATHCAEQRIVERPHLVTFVGLGALGWVLARVEAGRVRALWAVVPIVFVWANLHAGVFFAPLVLGLRLAGAMLDARLRREPSRLPPGPTALALGGAVAATFATPAGPMLPSYLLWHTGLGATRNVEEFRRAEPYSDPWFFALGALVAGWALASQARRRPCLREVLPLVVVWLLAARSVRFAAEWGMLAAPAVALALRDLRRALVGPAGSRTTLVATAVMLALAVRARLGAAAPLGLDPAVVPFEAIAFATREGLRERLFSDLDVGCYLLWEGQGRFAVFEDARLPAYPDAHHRELDASVGDDAAFEAILARHGVQAALVADADVNPRAAQLDPARWALVYRDAHALVFARRIGRHAEVIARHEIPLRPRFAFRGGTRFEALPRPAASTVDPCAWEVRAGDALEGVGAVDAALEARGRALAGGCLPAALEVPVRFHLASRMHRAGRAAEARAAYDALLAIAPDHPGALANRGFLRLAVEPAAGRADLARALALDPSRADVRRALSQR